MSDHETSQDTNSTQSQHDLVTLNSNNKTDDTFVQPEESSHYGSQAVLKLAINESIRSGADAVKKNSRIIAHVLVSCYCFWMLAIICDEYFMASIHVFCHSMY